MAKDPAFLFYPGDFLGGTQTFTDEQVGKYMRLLLAQFHKSKLNEKDMLTICKGYDDEIFSKFSRDSSGLYFNERLDFEVKKRKNYTASRKKNASSPKAYIKHMQPHMENENENENINESKNENEDEKGKGVQGENQAAPINGKLEIFDAIFTDDRFISELVALHPMKNLQKAFEECFLYHSQNSSPPGEVWQWKQKFTTWLKNSGNGAHNKPSKADERRETIAKRYGSKPIE